PVPSIETDWGPWLKANPGTVAYEMKPIFTPQPIPAGVLSESRQTRPEFTDKRLDPEARVFGLAVGDEALAWPIDRALGTARVPGLFRGERAARPVYVVFWDGSTRSAAAYAPETEGDTPRKLTFALDPDPAAPAPWKDKETGSSWAITGRAVAGPLK